MPELNIFLFKVSKRLYLVFILQRLRRHILYLVLCQL